MIVEVVDDEEECDYDEEEEEFFEETFNKNDESVDDEGIIFEENKYQTKLKIFLELSKSVNVTTNC